MSTTGADTRFDKSEIFDRVAALLGVAALSPLIALIGLLVKLDSPGPVFFKQKRIGLKETQFTAYKFRTMTENADKEWHPPQRVNDFSTFVFHSIWPDKRVTRLGRILRTSSLDELPQLFNVVRGDMRLVGPRPDEPYLVEAVPPGVPPPPRREARHHRPRPGQRSLGFDVLSDDGVRFAVRRPSSLPAGPGHPGPHTVRSRAEGRSPVTPGPRFEPSRMKGAAAR